MRAALWGRTSSFTRRPRARAVPERWSLPKAVVVFSSCSLANGRNSCKKKKTLFLAFLHTHPHTPHMAQATQGATARVAAAASHAKGLTAVGVGTSLPGVRLVTWTRTIPAVINRMCFDDQQKNLRVKTEKCHPYTSALVTALVLGAVSLASDETSLVEYLGGAVLVQVESS
jgi:protein gp37